MKFLKIRKKTKSFFFRLKPNHKDRIRIFENEAQDMLDTDNNTADLHSIIEKLII